MTLHMEMRHGISLEQYYDQHVVNSRRNVKVKQEEDEFLPAALGGRDFYSDEEQKFDVSHCEIKVESSSPSKESESKRAKTSDTSTTLSTSSTGRSLSSISGGGGDQVVLQEVKLERPDHLPWYQGCAYNCFLCGIVLWRKGDLRNHLRQGHAVKDWAQFSDIRIEKAFVGKYSCKICKTSITHEKSFISRHLEKEHDGMSLKAYEASFAFEKRPVEVGPCEEELNWYDSSLLACSRCPQVSRSYLTLKEHSRVKHGSHGFRKIQDFNTVGERSFSCHICLADIPHYYLPIRNHVFQKHPGLGNLNTYHMDRMWKSKLIGDRIAFVRLRRIQTGSPQEPIRLS